MTGMQRVQIIGYSGSGKTTLAKKLEKKLGIAHTEIDALHFLPNWQEKPAEEFSRDVKRAMDKNTWILCGDYINKLEGETLKRADTVIWLNYPVRIWLARVIRRNFKRSISREELWNGNKESFVDFWFRPSKSLLFFVVDLYRKQGRRGREEKLKKYNFKGRLIEFTHPRQAEKWLNSL